MTSTPYGIAPDELLQYIIRPTLLYLGLHSRSAEVLVLGTGMVESELRHLDQIDKARKPGPAFGLWQMEGPTHADLYQNFLPARPDLRNKVLRLASYFSGTFPDPAEMTGNLPYAAAMCRIRYLPAKDPLPAQNDAHALAECWLINYNRGGKGTIDRALPHFEFAITVT